MLCLKLGRETTDEYLSLRNPVSGQTLDYRDFEPIAVGEEAGVNTSDLAFRIFMVWNGTTQQLYLALEQFDDVYVNRYEGDGNFNGESPFNGILIYDGLEFMVDGDHSGGAYNGFSEEAFSEVERKQLVNAQAQHYSAVARAPDDRLLWNAGPAQGWVDLPPYADAGGFQYGEAPSHSVIELALTPWDDLDWQGPEHSRPSALFADKVIGFHINIPDFDSQPGFYHGFHSLAGQSNTWRTADHFVDGLLVPCNWGDCGAAPIPGITTVHTDSWGRIKASFR